MTARVSKHEERLAFQRLLDDRFPIGGLCATFFEQEGRLRPTGVEVATGRLLCVAVKRAKGGGWWHQVLTDPRRDVDEPVTAMVLWIGDLERHDVLPGLWAARIQSSGEARSLRIHADPDPPMRPTRRMRQAVTEAHRAEIPGAATPSTG